MHDFYQGECGFRNDVYARGSDPDRLQVARTAVGHVTLRHGTLCAAI